MQIARDLLNYENITDKTKKRTLNELKQACSNCFKCELGKTRQNIVFSAGKENSKIMLIGEAPGKNEDETGFPFVGRAGKLLDKLLLTQGFSREENIYICNIIKCRPPNNRVPTKTEIEACTVYLEAQIQLVRPKIILLAGATSTKVILKNKIPISKIRGQFFEGPFESKIMPIFHPSYLLRYQSEKEGTPKWLMLEDIKKIKKELESYE